MHTEDGYIISKCLEGDQSAFGFLVDKYKESIYAHAYSRLHNFHDAEDIAQEVFIIAYRKLHTLKRWDSIMAWLYSITSNLCKLKIRAQSRRPDSEFIEDQNQETLDQPSIDHYQESSALESINDALNSLPDIHREILSLHYLAGMKVMDISKYLGMSPRTIASRLKDARLRLKEEVFEMMNTSFEEQKLRAGFTIRILEMIKNIRINPLSQTRVPWGLSLATGLVMAIIGIGSHVSLENEDYQSISSAGGESKVLNVGEFPIDIMKVSDISAMANAGSNGNGSGNAEPSIQNALFMAPQAEGGTWIKKADMPTARGLLSTCEVDGKIYAIGGYIRNANGWIEELQTVEEYDPVINKWTRKSNMPTARSSLSTSVVDGKIYAIGGVWGPEWASSIVEVYDPIADKWTRKSDMPTVRSGLSTCVVNGKIYAIGGLKWDNANGKNVYFSAVEEYDPDTDKWTKKTDMPTKRSSFASFASMIGGKIYVIGGGTDNFLSLVEEYDPIIDKWTRKADMPTVRVTTTTATNGKIYAIGGYEGNNKPVLSTVEEYDPKTDTWMKKADMPTARTSLSICAVNGKIYAVGGLVDQRGQVDTLTSVVEQYDPQTESKSINFKGKLPATWGSAKLAKTDR